jgi:phage-related protein
MKALKFVGSSLDDLTDFPLEARHESGFELWQSQRGLNPSDFRAMPAVGIGAFESGYMFWASGAIGRRVKSNRCNPLIDNPGVLPRRNVG